MHKLGGLWIFGSIKIDMQTSEENWEKIPLRLRSWKGVAHDNLDSILQFAFRTRSHIIMTKRRKEISYCSMSDTFYYIIIVKFFVLRHNSINLLTNNLSGEICLCRFRFFFMFGHWYLLSFVSLSCTNVFLNSHPNHTCSISGNSFLLRRYVWGKWVKSSNIENETEIFLLSHWFRVFFFFFFYFCEEREKEIGTSEENFW